MKSLDFRVHVGFFTHPKTLKLKRILGREGVYCLVRLWAEAAKNATSGLLADDADVIAEMADWPGDPRQFVETLASVGFIEKADGGWHIHDWEQHNPWVAGRETRREVARKNAASRWRRRTNDVSASRCEDSTSALQNQQDCNADFPDPQSDIHNAAMLPSSPLPSSPLTRNKKKSGEKAANAWAKWVDACRANGRADPIPTGPELGAAKQLAKNLGEDELAEIMNAYLNDNDKFIVGNGHSLTLLLRRAEKYRAKPQQQYSVAGGVKIDI